MRAFEARDGFAVAELDHEERAVLGRIVADVGLLLGGDVFGMESDPGRPQPHLSAEEELFQHLIGLEEALNEPNDPAILRLLPNAAPDDREVADEFRRLTEKSLRDLKVTRLRTMWSAMCEEGPEWEVPLDEAMAIAGALTDVRLVLASRLGLTTDEDAERLHTEISLAEHALDTDADEQLGIDPERVWLGMLYQALSWLQESLMGIVMEGAEHE